MIHRSRQKVYNKYNGKCAYCGQEIDMKDMQIDHVICKKNFLMHIKNKWKIPKFLSHLTEDDVNHHDNLFPTCRICNNWKSTFDVESFRSEIAIQIERLKMYNPNYRLACRYGLINETNVPILFHFEKELENGTT